MFKNKLLAFYATSFLLSGIILNHQKEAKAGLLSLISVENVTIFNINMGMNLSASANQAKNSNALTASTDVNTDSFVYTLQGGRWLSYPTGTNAYNIRNAIFGTESNNYWKFNFSLSVSHDDGAEPEPADYETWDINGSLQHLTTEEGKIGEIMPFAFSFNTSTVKIKIPHVGDTTTHKENHKGEVKKGHVTKADDLIINDGTYLNAISIQHLDDGGLDSTAVIGNWILRIEGQHQKHGCACTIGTCGSSLPKKSIFADIGKMIESVFIQPAYANHPCEIPEPSTNLGLLTIGIFGFLGTASKLKRKKNTLASFDNELVEETDNNN